MDIAVNFIAITILISLGSYLVALRQKSSKWKYILKMSTIALIIVLAVTAALRDSNPSNLYSSFVIIGLCLSLLGDYFLMLPSDKFIQGIAAFFLAHILYIAAFLQNIKLEMHSPLLILLLLLFAAAYYSKIYKGIVREGGNLLQIAVISYIAILGVMFYTAYLSNNISLTVGTLLFVISDALLAWERFIKPFPGSPEAITCTYFVAQYLIAMSIIDFGGN